MRSFLVLSALAFTACTEETACALVGEFSGTFTGDAEGDVTLSIVDGEGGALIEIEVTNDDLAALGSGSISCEDGSFVTELTIDDELVGEIAGTIEEGGVGVGTWEFTAGDFAGLSGDWSMGQ